MFTVVIILKVASVPLPLPSPCPLLPSPFDWGLLTITHYFLFFTARVTAPRSKSVRRRLEVSVPKPPLSSSDWAFLSNATTNTYPQSRECATAFSYNLFHSLTLITFLWLSHEIPILFFDIPMPFLGTPMHYLWNSHVLPMKLNFLLSYELFMNCVWTSHELPITSHDFPITSLGTSYDFPRKFLWRSHELLMAFKLYSYNLAVVT